MTIATLKAIARLEKARVTQTIMLTGDNRVVVYRVANQLGLDTYKAKLLLLIVVSFSVLPVVSH